ncbi:hypothetical protein [Leptolyngbya sp. 7M]|uniref:Vgb family protein n=1 Tax=Leptolyngbya sp. 7M TaxID=2812896 RepID=UPI001B8DA49C|nr:hypothetical protein [Leptolyngbya sp. 7M]QYO65851.1 hypothetical protein JVX88_03380 [Leptolyngbya sp. 7M]
MKKILIKHALFLPLLLIVIETSYAQTSSFTYQGKLTEMHTIANGPYDLMFRLYDSAVGGDQIDGAAACNGVTSGSPDAVCDDVSVSGGIFSVKLSFGEAAFINGEPRFLEIHVRPGASTGEYTQLTPRQEITSTPFSVKSLRAAAADSLSTACVLCVTDAKIRSIDANKLTGILPITSGGTGSSAKNFVDLFSNQNVFGNKTFNNGVTFNSGVTLNQSLTINGSLDVPNGIVSADQFHGNGDGLTNLDGANIIPGSITTTQLSSDTLLNTGNLKVLGTLRWDQLRAQRVFNIGNQPYGIASDGANIWVVEFNGSTVKKIRASDGMVLGTFTVGNALRFIAFDGANMWITSTTPSAGVIKVRTSDGAVLGTFPTPSAAFNLAFDGENMWVLNGNNVTKLRVTDGANLGTFPAGSSPAGIAFDGAFMWITHLGAAGLKKLNVADGTSVDYSMTTGGGVVFDGSNIWIANTTAGSVVRIRTLDGSILNSYPIASGAYQIAFDGTHLWVINNDFASGVAAKVRASDGVTIASFALGALPTSITFDGKNMWATNTNSNTVIRLPPAFQP